MSNKLKQAHTHTMIKKFIALKPVWKFSIATASIGLFAWLAFGFFGIQAIWTTNEANETISNDITSVISNPNSAGANKALIGKGSFKPGDSTYTIEGNAFLTKINGKLNLTFTDFDVTNGPDLFVYAVKTNSTDNKTVKQTVANGDFINLGTLKGNVGNQNYRLELDFDAEEYQTITIWCRRFSRNFGSVQLVEVANNQAKPSDLKS